MNNEEAIENLKKYINEDFAYRKPIKNMSDFDRFCYNHCKDIDTVLNYIEKLKNMHQKEYNEHMEMKRQNGVLINNERILKEKNEELEKKNKDLCENYCPKYKELEEKLKIQTQNYNSAYEDINWFCANYIPKQKVRDKIDKLKREFDFYAGREHSEWEDGEFDGDVCDDIALKIEALKELLKEEKNE